MSRSLVSHFDYDSTYTSIHKGDYIAFEKYTYSLSFCFCHYWELKKKKKKAREREMYREIGRERLRFFSRALLDLRKRGVLCSWSLSAFSRKSKEVFFELRWSRNKGAYTPIFKPKRIDKKINWFGSYSRYFLTYECFWWNWCILS